MFHVKMMRLTLSLGHFKICLLNVGVLNMKKFSHRGGVLGRRKRALSKLQKVKKPNKKQLYDIEILEKRIKEIILK